MRLRRRSLFALYYHIDALQVPLSSKDFGKHLLEVEDLLQKHSLLEADISAQTERVYKALKRARTDELA